jgi:hypothetical protein
MPRAFRIAASATGCALALASAASAQDRYGPTPGAYGVAASAAAATPLRARFLSWTGKAVSAAAPAPAAAPAQAVWQGRLSAAPVAGGRSLAAYRAAPVGQQGWRPVPLRSAAAPGPQPTPALAGAPQPQTLAARPLPTSIYAPPAQGAATGVAAMPAPRYRTAANSGADDRVRFYSVHRQYGLQPDPPPIPPQFFGATADLSDPPGPIPAQRLTTGAGGATRTVRPTTDSSDGGAGQP